MDTFRLHGNMLLGTEAAPGTEGAALCLETARLRALGAGACLVQVRWDLVEPEQGRYQEEALEALRERLIRLRSQGIRPVLSLHRDGEPAWFLQRGGWEREDNLRCYLRYVGKILRSLGHLAEEYITFCNPNVAVWQEEAGEGRRGFLRRTLMLSHIACTHVRAYRLIHDFRERRGWRDTAVGFSLGMYPLPREKGVISRVFSPEALHRSLPLRAMARGEFAPPLRNVLRVRPGKWCDFAGLGWAPEAAGGRALALYCMMAARAARRAPVRPGRGKARGRRGPDAVYLREPAGAALFPPAGAALFLPAPGGRRGTSGPGPERARGLSAAQRTVPGGSRPGRRCDRGPGAGPGGGRAGTEPPGRNPGGRPGGGDRTGCRGGAGVSLAGGDGGDGCTRNFCRCHGRIWPAGGGIGMISCW